MRARLYLYVNALSDFGMYMDTIVLNIVILSLTDNSAGWLSAVLGARVIGGFCSALFAGVLADRFDRRKIMITTDILRLVTVLLLIPFPNPYVILVACFLIGFLTAMFQVSFNSELPQIFGEENVLRTNVLVQRLASIAMVSGFLGASVIAQYVSYQAALAIDAMSYLLSAVVLWRMKWNATQPVADKQAARTVSSIVRNYVSDMGEVKRYLVTNPALLVCYMVLLVEVFASSSYAIGIPLLAKDISSEGSSLLYGLIWATLGSGIILGTMLIPKFTKAKDHLYTSYLVSALAFVGFCVAYMSTPNAWIVFPFAFIAGVFDAGILTFYATIMQKTDNAVRGRIFGVSALANRMGYGLGFLLIPLTLNFVTYSQVVWIFQGLLLVVVVVAMVVLSRLRAKQKTTADSTTSIHS